MKNKRKLPGILFLCFCLAALLFCLELGDPYCSASAAADLTEALEEVYGPEYTGKTVENGSEDMRFEIESKTRFLRNGLGLDHKYECRVIFTTHAADGSVQTRTVTYRATDPMGREEIDRRASIDWDSSQEATE